MNAYFTAPKWRYGWVLAVSMALLAATACSSPTAVSVGRCVGNRVVIVGLSSSERSPDHVNWVNDMMTAVLATAAVCGEAITAVAISGGANRPLFDTAVVKELHLDADDPAVREHRVKGSGDGIHSRVEAAVATALTELTSVDSSSVDVAYDIAAQHVSGPTQVLMLVDGVQHADGVDLNRPLEVGEGARLAATLSVPTLPTGTTVVVAGLGQVDADRPVPGSTWIREIQAFNDALCARSLPATSCQTFTSGTAETILSPGEHPAS